MTINDPSTHDIVIRPGAKWDLTLIYMDNNKVPINLTGYTAFCEIRTRAGGELLATPTPTITAGAGQINLVLLPVATVAIGAEVGVYDVLIRKDSDHTQISYLVGGNAYIKPIATNVAWV
jgi:hypothetical protein